MSVRITLTSSDPTCEHAWEVELPGGSDATKLYTEFANVLINDVIGKLGAIFTAADLGLIAPGDVWTKARGLETAVQAAPDGL